MYFYFTWTEEELHYFWDYWYTGPMVYPNIGVLLIFTLDIIIEFHIGIFKQGAYITDRGKVNYSINKLIKQDCKKLFAKRFPL